MKTFLIAVLVCSTWCLLARARNDEQPITETIKNWRTLRISLKIDGGDVFPPAPFILLQRLDADRIVLSTGKSGFGTESLPLARAIVTADTAQRFIEHALAFYAQAQKETGEKARVNSLPPAERDAIYKKAGFGISASYIGIEILDANGNHQYLDDFADGSATRKEFEEFITQHNAQAK